ncbi:hypothetical protein VTN49DRAFT_3694 [Thermomyces lanuginosus]|uniref:uncharacterized protein n=1 Tax=Thermomyces lanuginosus TaxID=5541 RepID=UPI0037439C89
MFWLIVLAAAVHAMDISWHKPSATDINNLDKVLHGDGVFGFIFNSSDTPRRQYGVYNYCNMPHVRMTEYKRAPRDYELVYVEAIHRHHKRTPYQSNTFPVENYPWNCDDTRLFYHGATDSLFQPRANTYWKFVDSPLNIFSTSGFDGTCTFPQLTAEGLEDSFQHGRDLFGVYHDMLKFLPRHLDNDVVQFRVTNNVITSEVASMIIAGMYGPQREAPLHIQREGVDSLEPQYSCPKGSSLFSNIKSTRNDSPWKEHLDLTRELFESLDDISGVPPDAEDWHNSFDHYFDSLSSRLCHHKPLPCNIDDPHKCVTQDQTNTVLRLGQWEYSYIYRDSPSSLEASTATFGLWLAELASHLRDQITHLTSPGWKKGKRVLYRHNVAHDGSVSRLLSILQLDKMVWPGMGAEVVFELYRQRQKFGWKHEDKFFVRVLWGGKVMTSSNPDLGTMDMIPVERLLDYIDSLVGPKGSKIPTLCGV